MEIGVGLDHTLGMNWDDQANLAREAAELGYESIWTPENIGTDSFQVCARRWQASCDVVDGGLTTGIGVSPVMYRTPIGFAMSGGTLSQQTGGKFIMGIGAGSAYRPANRRDLGFPRVSALNLMRDYLTTIKGLVNGERVSHQGEYINYNNIRMAIRPAPNTPVYLGTLGPEMLRLAGEIADGVCLNWCTPEQIAWSRDRIAEGAERVGRDPSEVKVVEYIRICVDDDEDVARRSFAKNCLGYPLGAAVPTDRERQFGYRAHFERMGYTEELAGADAIRREGGDMDAVADAYPSEALLAVGYYGKPDGAAAAFAKLAEGLDVALVRVIAARPEIASTQAARRITMSAQAVMQACAPEKVRAALV